LATVLATDSDYGEDGEVEYSIVCKYSVILPHQVNSTVSASIQ